MTRFPEKAAALREGGAEPVVVDALDAARVRQAAVRAAPESDAWSPRATVAGPTSAPDRV